MNDYIVLKGKDGFYKEFDRKEEDKSDRYVYVIRQYERLTTKVSGYFFTEIPDQLKVIDRQFILRCEFNCMGKRVCYYEENR